MKIALIDKEEGLIIGGITVFTKRLQNHIVSSGHKVYILRFTNKKRIPNGIYRIPYYFAEPRSFIFLPSEKTLSLIKNYLIKIKPDIVYTSIGLSPLDFFLPSLCHELKIPIAGVWHADFNYSSGSYQLLAKSAFLTYLPFCKQLDLLHVFSEKLKEFYIKRGIIEKRLLVLPNGVDPGIYSPSHSSFAKEKQIKTGILFLGRLTVQKNPEILIRSFLKLNPEKDTKLVLVGHGEKEKSLRKKFQDKKILFTGVVRDEKRKIDLIRSCKIFVLPSRFEGMPLSLLEAMSCGLACIASDAGSNAELLDKAGIVIPVTDIQEKLPFVLQLLLDHPEFCQLLGKKARNKVINYYSQNTIFNQLISAFEQTILSFKRKGYLKTKPLDLNLIISKKLKLFWKKTKQLGSTIIDDVYIS